jgi:cell division protein FtsX
VTAGWILRRARRDVRRRALRFVALVGAFAAFAALAGAAVLGARAATALAPLLEHEVHLIAYLRDDVPADRLGALVDILGRIPGVRAARAVGQDEALRRR